MATEIWRARTEIHDKVMHLVAQNHPDLALVSDEILVFFRETATASAPLGSIKKATAEHEALRGESLSFIITLPADTWENLTSRQQEACLDFLLCAAQCEEDPKNGTLKKKIVKPDVMIFRENFERYGLWQPEEKSEEEQTDEEVMVKADLVDALSGDTTTQGGPVAEA